MSRKFLASCVTGAVVVLAALLFVFTGNGSEGDHAASNKPVLVTPGPVGLTSGTAPSPSGSMWLLSNTPKGANLQRVRSQSGRVLGIIPLPKEAQVVAESSGGYLGVGLAGVRSGAIVLLGSTGGATLGTIPVSGPVQDLVAGVDGLTMYALTQSGSARVVDIAILANRKVMSHVPVPLHTVSIAVTADQTTLFALESNGGISIIDLGTSRVTQKFQVGPDARHLAVTLDGTKFLVLKGPLNSNNVSVIDVATQRTVYVSPAPANTRSIIATADGSQIVNFVGTNIVGNVQSFLISQ